MKVVVITIVILALFLGGAFYFAEYINMNSEKMLNNIEALDQAVLAEDWESAEIQLNKTEKNWKEMHKVYEVILEHYDLDAINKSLAKIDKYIEVQDKTLTLGEITQLKFVIDLIKKRESFTLSNLL